MICTWVEIRVPSSDFPRRSFQSGGVIQTPVSESPSEWVIVDYSVEVILKTA